MYKIIFITYLSIILSYINCSECSENKNSTDDETCSKLRVEDEMTQVCIKKSSEGKGCKETNICTEVLSTANDEICSKLSVSPDKNNTHICIKSTLLTFTECKTLYKRLYGLDDEKELSIIMPFLIEDSNENGFFNPKNYLVFNLSSGHYHTMEDCLREDLLEKYGFTQKCIEESECLNVKYVN